MLAAHISVPPDNEIKSRKKFDPVPSVAKGPDITYL